MVPWVWGHCPVMVSLVRRWHPVQWPGLTFDPASDADWPSTGLLRSVFSPVTGGQRGRFCYGIGWGL